MNGTSTKTGTANEVDDRLYDMENGTQPEQDEDTPRVLRLGERRVGYDKRLAEGFGMLGLS